MPYKYSQSAPVFVLIGPSGAGKSALAGELITGYPELFDLTHKYTTRPQRSVEKDSFSEDIFVDETTFQKMKEAGAFVGTVKPFGLPFEYGTPWFRTTKPKQVPLVLLRAFVVETLLANYKKPIIYQLEVDKDLAISRMRRRGQSEADIAARLQGFDKEIVEGRKFASRTFSNNKGLEVLTDDVVSFFKQDVSVLI